MQNRIEAQLATIQRTPAWTAMLAAERAENYRARLEATNQHIAVCKDITIREKSAAEKLQAATDVCTAAYAAYQAALARLDEVGRTSRGLFAERMAAEAMNAKAMNATVDPQLASLLRDAYAAIDSVRSTFAARETTEHDPVSGGDWLLTSHNGAIIDRGVDEARAIADEAVRLSVTVTEPAELDAIVATLRARLTRLAPSAMAA